MASAQPRTSWSTGSTLLWKGKAEECVWLDLPDTTAIPCRGRAAGKCHARALLPCHRRLQHLWIAQQGSSPVLSNLTEISPKTSKFISELNLKISEFAFYKSHFRCRRRWVRNSKAS
jgi:hypothetical protein